MGAAVVFCLSDSSKNIRNVPTLTNCDDVTESVKIARDTSRL